MPIQPVPTEVRGTPCHEDWRGWSVEGFGGKAGVSELVCLVGHICAGSNVVGLFWVPQVPFLGQHRHASGLGEVERRLFLVH